ncbi:MAG: MMPL family transporter, partial [Rhodospirillales bacterium]
MAEPRPANETSPAAIARWAGALAGFSAARPWPVLLAGLLLTLLSAWVIAERFAISTDNTDMLAADLPFRIHDRELAAAFPDRPGALVAVIEGVTPEDADEATRIVRARLEAEPELFGALTDLAGEPFFARNGLLYLETEDLQDLADRLARAQPFLARLGEQPGLASLMDLLEDALDVAAEGRALPIDLAPVLAELAAVVEAHNKGQPATLSWRRLLGGERASGPSRRVLLLSPPPDYGSLAPIGRAVKRLKAIRTELGLQPGHDGAGPTLWLTGPAFMEQEELASVEDGMGLAGGLSLVLVTVLLWLALKSGRAVAGLVLALLAGLVWTAAFAFLAVGTLNLISVAFAVLFIGLSVDFGIHFALRAREEDDFPSPRSLKAAGLALGAPLTLAATTAAAGFLSFLPTDYLGLAQLGLIAGGGMFIALFANLTLLPAWLALTRPKARVEAKRDRKRVDGFAGFNPGRLRAKRIAFGFALLAALAVVPALEARFDFDPLNLRDPQSESVAQAKRLMAEAQNGAYAIKILAPDLATAEAWANDLKGLSSVAQVRRLTSFLPDNQDEKLLIVEDLALILEPALAPEAATPSPPAPERTRMEAFAGRLERDAVGFSFAAAEWSRRLARGLAEAKDPADLQEVLFEHWPAALAALRTSLQAAPVSLADLPPSITE